MSSAKPFHGGNSDGNVLAGGWSAMSVLSLVQGTYYVVTGFWPLVSIRTFQIITGPKTDLWLVKTAGALIGVIGSVLTLAGLRRRHGPEIPLLAAGSAGALAAIDIVYASRKRISRVYLVDGAFELFLVAGWLVAWRRGQ